MADISLREYIEYIESRLSRDAFAEVVAQARHILETYPKHIDTYRVLAKAIAAQENYTDALDLFQRVLSAEPSDFIAHVGMAECYKEDGALDQAIWHLERAFEMAPSNSDIQNEIKKLFEQRDGHIPLKIPMTSGALARMYVKGKLYGQAISELTKGLAQDPERLDLQTLLAEALWNNHQEVPAGRVAAEVLKKLPYSIEANSLLARLWLKAGKPGEARPFIERAKELDPYVGYELEHNGASAPPDSFRLSLLESVSDSLTEQAPSADWVSQIPGIEKQKGVTGPLKSGQITDIFAPPPAPAAPAAQAAPDWLQAALGLNGSAEGAPAKGEPEPDWLKSALGGSAPAAPAAAGAAPDWMKDVLNTSPSATPAPAGQRPSSKPLATTVLPETLGDNAPDWLREAAQDTPPAKPSSKQMATSVLPETLGDNTPDWLREAVQETPPTPVGKPGQAPNAGDANTPEWLQDVLGEQTPPSLPPVGSQERQKPAWLNDVLSDETPAAPAPALTPKPAGPALVTTDMLNRILSEGTKMLPEDALETAGPPTGADMQFDDLGDLETWDGPLPAGVEPGEPAGQAKDEKPLPDWLTSGPTVVEAAPKAEEAEPAKEDLPEWLREATSMAEPAAEVEDKAGEPPAQEAMPDWLKGSALPQAAAASAGEKPPADDMPDWLREAAAPVPAHEEAPNAKAADEATGEIPDWLAGEMMADGAAVEDKPAAATESAHVEPQHEMPAADSQPLEAAHAEPAGSERPDREMPDWLKDEALASGLSAESSHPAAAETTHPEPEQAEALEAELPGSLTTEMAPEAASAAEPEEETNVAPLDQPTGDNSSDEVPDWLSSGDLDSDDALKWLEELAAKVDPNFKPDSQPAEAEAPTPAPAAEPPAPVPAAETPAPAPVAAADSVEKEAEDLPDWLKAVDLPAEPAKAEAAPAAPAAAPAGASLADDLDWLRIPTEPAAAAKDEADELPDWLKGEPEKPAAQAAAAPTDDALAWLDQEIEKQGVSPAAPVSEALTPDHPPVVSPMPAVDLDAEAKPASDDELPDWLRGEDVQGEISKALEAPAAEAEMADLPELPVEADELAWLNDALKAEEEAAGPDDLEALFGEARPAAPAPAPEPAAPVAAVEPPMEKEAPAVPAPAAEAKAPALDELPDWLRGEEAPAPKLAPADEKAAADELPSWLTGEPEPLAAKPAPEPAVEAPKLEEKGDELPGWLSGAAEPEPVHTGLTDFLKAVEPAATPAAPPPAEPAPAPQPVAAAVPAAPPAPVPVAPPAPAPVAPAAVPASRVTVPAGEADSQLSAARLQMSNGEVPAALVIYESLIGSGHKYDEVLADLTDLTKSRAIVNPKVYRVMGDALMGKGKTVEAMEMFRKALDSF